MCWCPLQQINSYIYLFLDIVIHLLIWHITPTMTSRALANHWSVTFVFGSFRETLLVCNHVIVPPYIQCRLLNCQRKMSARASVRLEPEQITDLTELFDTVSYILNLFCFVIKKHWRTVDFHWKHTGFVWHSRHFGFGDRFN